MGAPAPAPRKRTVRKRTAPQATPPGGAGAAPAAPTPPADAAAELSLNEWLHEVNTRPHRIQVFDRWWEFKQPTGGRAAEWNQLCGPDIRSALAAMLVDQTPADEQSPPGTKAADEFLVAAAQWVPPDQGEEFWERFSRALFGLGEA